jgi:L-serine dehydratase
MKAASILNHVLGPVMRGPSSSHTAGAYHIASLARDLLGEAPRRACFRFDRRGSYAHTYVQQGADRAFAMGLRNRPLTDESFFTCLQEPGLEIHFEVGDLAGADHPNTVDIELSGPEGRVLALRARSIGGGEVEIFRVDRWTVLLLGTSHAALAESPASLSRQVEEILSADGMAFEGPRTILSGERALVLGHRKAPLPAALRRQLGELPGCTYREASPVYFLQGGEPLFHSAQEMVAMAEARQLSLGQLALAYEAQRLERTETQVLTEMVRRYRIMRQAVVRGLEPDITGMQLLEPSAGSVMGTCRAGRLAVGGIHARAAARALAVMHVNSAMGVVCAAPTGGSAGTIPGVVVTLAEERGLSEEEAARLLLAAGLIGVFVSNRATFAAEVAGCQVEIGAAGAMAAAAVVEAAEGSARQAADAAAIAFQNTMGSVCDLVQGMVEIPCHTRNALAASSAFVCADLILGGYQNPVPLDETIDAVLAVGKLLPPELRCTAKGGLALAPSALRLCSRSCK